ncbi:MAG: hypothetical protein J5968_04190 [Oscillospiraceae bacterium]|nr:hypothetical protein [Oscillospiraceae bacterium]
MVCTFFGHRDCPIDIKTKLYNAAKKLIEKHDVDTFLVGDKGKFDFIARTVLEKLSNEYPHIKYNVVLAYMPGKRDEFCEGDISNTILPMGIEIVPKRIAIPWRNKWMLDRADYVLAYVVCSQGGAANYVEKALKKGKTVINIAEM